MRQRARGVVTRMWLIHSGQEVAGLEIDFGQPRLLPSSHQQDVPTYRTVPTSVCRRY